MGAVAIGYGLEATKRRMETEEALAEVTRTETHSRNLAYLALLSEIREQEQRRGQMMGADVFEKIRSAAALNPSEELRTEALKRAEDMAKKEAKRKHKEIVFLLKHQHSCLSELTPFVVEHQTDVAHQ